MSQKTQCPGCGHWYGNIRGSHYSRRPDCRRAYEAQLRRLANRWMGQQDQEGLPAELTL